MVCQRLKREELGPWRLRGAHIFMSLSLLNSGRSSLAKKGNSVLRFGSRKTV